MKKRKPILLIDDSINSQRIKKMLIDNEIDFVEHHIKKFEESCCGELPTTKAPSVIASEGIYKEDKNIENYIKYLKEKQKEQSFKDLNSIKIKEEDDSAYW